MGANDVLLYTGASNPNNVLLGVTLPATGGTVLTNHRGTGRYLTKKRFLELKEEWRKEALEAAKAAEKRAKEIKRSTDRKKALRAAEEAEEAIRAAHEAVQVANLVPLLEAMAAANKATQAINESRRVYEEAMRLLEEQDEEEAIMLLI